jgi:hypothetical protein
MRKTFALSVALILVLLLAAPATHAKSLILNNVPTQVYFSPNGGCTEAIVEEISNAQKRDPGPGLFLHLHPHCQGFS